MNRLFGATATSAETAARAFDACVEWLRASQAAELSDRSLEGAKLGIGADGSILGVARHGSFQLAYLGQFQQPFPGWTEAGSPMDDPSRTAEHLLKRFRERGPSFLDGVAGHYVVVVIEPSGVLLARDPEGYRRLFYAERDGELVFSSQLADMRGLLGKALRVERAWEDFLLGYEFLPGDRTLFEGVKVLPAGKTLHWSNGEATFTPIAPPKPWRDWLDDEALEKIRDPDVDENLVVESLHQAFTRAVQEQLSSDERVGVLLGGFDSALIASELRRQGKRVETFSFHYDDPSYNQAHCEELAELIGASHHWVPITADVMRDGLDHYASRFNQPVCQPHYVIASGALCRAVRERGLHHCFTGDGCDGLFLGYPTVHQRAVLIQNLARSGPLLRALRPLARSPFLERKLGHPYRVARNVLNVLGRPMPARAHIAACTLDPFSLRQLRTEAPPPQERDVEEVLLELAEGLDSISPVRLAYRGKGAVGLNKVKLEGASAYAGITLSSPFLHPGMARLAQAIPEQLSRPSRRTKAESTGKYALMRMAEEHRLLPPHIIYQKKRSPVTAPVDDWYLGELRSFMLGQLAGLPFDYDRRYAESLLERKLSEDIFRKHIGISRYTSNAASLLAAYASFTKLAAD